MLHFFGSINDEEVKSYSYMINQLLTMSERELKFNIWMSSAYLTLVAVFFFNKKAKFICQKFLSIIA